GAIVILLTHGREAGKSPWIDAKSKKLTGHIGAEFFPSLSPDGQSLVYEYKIDGQQDIFFKDVDGTGWKNLTADSPENDTMPAFSPDGERIAFRSDRDGGGIFVMDRNGENVRQLTNEGYNPAWSSDGKEIVYATGQARNPYSRGTASS